MRLVILEAESLGKDMDLSGFSRFGEVTVYEKTTEEECPERVREADIVICNKVRMCSRTLSGAENLKLIDAVVEILDARARPARRAGR